MLYLKVDQFCLFTKIALVKMSIQFQQILQHATLLSPKEQLVLNASLSQLLVQQEIDLDNDSFKLSSSEEKVLTNRMEQVERSEIKAIPWKDALADIRKE